MFVTSPVARKGGGGGWPWQWPLNIDKYPSVKMSYEKIWCWSYAGIKFTELLENDEFNN